MEIHAPDTPVHSFKDFLIHISIVTVGILIALGLEGLRETVHNHHLIRETRENVHTEMGHDREHAVAECGKVSETAALLSRLTTHLELLTARPGEVTAELQQATNPGYFLAANSWQTALSTGVLAHIPTTEVSAYAYAAEGIQRYTQLQNRAGTQEAIAKATVAANSRPTPEGAQAAARELLLFARYQQDLAYVCPQMQADIDRAYAASER